MRIGSLFSGYGGLECGIREVFPDATVAWHAEFDRDPSLILAHHWPDVPNYGDVTKIDWAAVEPVDIICGGSPCQDLSHAGKRAGMRAGTRSGLWASMCDAIEIIRPALVVWENVRGALSVGADSAVEPCPFCVGDKPGTTLRALGRVLGDLAELGYDATWGVVRAADAGAPHGRARIFILATPDAGGGPLPRPAAAGDGLPVAAERSDLAAAAARRERHGSGQDGRSLGRLDGSDAVEARERERPRGVAVDRGAAAPADAAGERRGEGLHESARLVGGSDAAVSGGAVATDTERCRLDGRAPEPQRGPLDRVAATGRGEGFDAWGDYAPAITRWAGVLGRPAPRPTEPGRNGPRLSPAFVEWMMGLPAGHVTDVPDLSRNAQLKALGNGVVPQQAALALRTLLAVAERAA